MPGASLHREMAAFEEAGIPRTDVWRLASLDAARVLGINDSGSIQVRMRAVALTSPISPFEAAWTSKQISAVVAGGNLMLSKDLDSSIDKELGRFSGSVTRLTSRSLTEFAVARLQGDTFPTSPYQIV